MPYGLPMGALGIHSQLGASFLFEANPIEECSAEQSKIGPEIQILLGRFPVPEITYFTRRTTYSNTKFDIIDLKKWLV